MMLLLEVVVKLIKCVNICVGAQPRRACAARRRGAFEAWTAEHEIEMMVKRKMQHGMLQSLAVSFLSLALALPAMAQEEAAEVMEQAEATGHGPQRAVASGAYGSLIPEGAPRRNRSTLYYAGSKGSHRTIRFSNLAILTRRM